MQLQGMEEGNTEYEDTGVRVGGIVQLQHIDF